MPTSIFPITVVKDLVNNGNWSWPVEWVSKYPELQQIQVITLSDRKDELVWKSRKGSFGKFSAKQAYIDLQPEEEHVIWSNGAGEHYYNYY